MTKKIVFIAYFIIFLGISGLPWIKGIETVDTNSKRNRLPQNEKQPQIKSELSIAQDILKWNRTFGSNNDDWANSVIQTRDHGYALAGASTKASEIINYDGWLVKTDVNGVEQFSQTYGSWKDEWAYSVIQTQDNGYALAGLTTTPVSGGNAWLVKTDADGVLQWNQTYGGIHFDIVHSVIQTLDGGFALVGYTISYGAGKRDFWLVKTDSQGLLQWNQTYGGPETDEAYSVIQTGDEGFILAGITNSYGSGENDGWLVKTDIRGNVQFTQTYGSEEEEWINEVIQTSDAGYILAGATSYKAEAVDAWLVKIDTNGELQWQENYDDSSFSDIPSWEEAYSVIQAPDNGFVLAGYTFSAGTQKDALIIKTDNFGRLEWIQIHGGPKEDVANTIIQPQDDSLVFVGSTFSYGEGGRDAWLVKTESGGFIAPNWFISTLMMPTMYATLVFVVFTKKIWSILCLIGLMVLIVSIIRKFRKKDKI